MIAAVTIVQTVLFLLKGVLSAVPGGAKYQVIADGIGAAIAELEKVHGTDVTKAQLESLRVEQKW